MYGFMDMALENQFAVAYCKLTAKKRRRSNQLRRERENSYELS